MIKDEYVIAYSSDCEPRSAYKKTQVSNLLLLIIVVWAFEIWKITNKERC